MRSLLDRLANLLTALADHIRPESDEDRKARLGQFYANARRAPVGYVPSPTSVTQLYEPPTRPYALWTGTYTDRDGLLFVVTDKDSNGNVWAKHDGCNYYIPAHQVQDYINELGLVTL